MGSIARFSGLERFIDRFGEKIEKHFQYLIGSTIMSMDDKEVNYHVKSLVTIGKNDWKESFEVHHRWATQEEDSMGKEDVEYTMEDYFNDHLKGKTITSIRTSMSDRDDEVYLFAIADNQESLEIPIGFNPEFGEIYGFAEDILTEQEIEDFFKRN